MDGVGLQLALQIYLAGFVEPVGEDLVHGTAHSPFGYGEFLWDAADLPAVAGLHIGVVPLLEQAEGAGAGGDDKMVEEQTPLFKGKTAPEDLIGTLLHLVGHGDFFCQGAVFTVDDALHSGSLNGGGYMDIQRAFLPRGQGTEGVFVQRLLAVEKNSHK